MLNFEMTFYAQKTPDGNYHVQNAIGGMMGQHHVHSEQSFHEWASQDGVNEVTMLKDGPCDCGLGVGDVREYNGKVWHNPKFA